MYKHGCGCGCGNSPSQLAIEVSKVSETLVTNYKASQFSSECQL